MDFSLLQKYFEWKHQMMFHDSKFSIDFKNKKIEVFDLGTEDVWNEDEERQILDIYIPIASCSFEEFEKWLKKQKGVE